ncbi:MAG: AtpZ/AtpI family protein [Deltaproteobacteria bacterium]|nr:AtpZ/AtpI family protein [Deltaproteobacteria bacterium]
MYRQAGQFVAVGLEMGIAMGIGILGGWYLDEWLDSKPICFWVGFFLGLGAAGKALFDASRKAQKVLMDDGKSSSKKD